MGGEKPALVTLNPPRKGCSEELLLSVCELAPVQIIYVSCDPVSLARDLGILTRNGYTLQQVQPVDMFPQTSHIETVVQLKKLKKKTRGVQSGRENRLERLQLQWRGNVHYVKYTTGKTAQ